MASIITLRRRINSIKGTRQITKAMELVSASKLRRAQAYAQTSRAYGQLATELIQKLSSINEVNRMPLFQKRPIKNRLYIVVTSNTGLAGAFNSNVLKLLTAGLNDDQSNHVTSHVIAIGSKGAQYVRRLAKVDLMAVYPPFGDQPTANDVRPVLNQVVEHFRQAKVDDVKIIYNQFKSTISQKPITLSLLPASTVPGSIKAQISNFEPDVETVVQQAATRLVEAQIWQSILESLASEHAMRMIATKNATDNANELIDDYTLELNSARQAAITQELAEISSGAEALNA